ncbi:MAG: 3-oxoacyl-[acyl-carrier protein] reductase [Myxococcaceae bacterium]|nr:3-oxoacyl-[acyl-carrier protein] reductase [Myxococcaceae bacterium]
MRDLRGKTVWITGASAGLGEALALRCAQQGARLLLSARRVDRLRAVARTALHAGATEVELLPLDLAELASLADKGAEALERMGRIDVMVHNAGVGQRALVSESTFEVDRQLLDVNFLGPVALTKTLLPSMLAAESGSFVVISSVLGLMSVKRRAAYCASKHALHGYFNSLRAEVHDRGIRVLMVCPGHIDSEFSQMALQADGRAHGVNEAGKRSGLSPDACAERTLRGLMRGEAEIYPAKWETLGLYLNRLSPALTRFAIASLKAR